MQIVSSPVYSQRSPVFAGVLPTRLNRKERAWIDQALDEYEAGLAALMRKDQKAHPEQPILQIRLERHLKKMRRFLKGQLKKLKKDPARAIPFTAVFAGGTASGKTLLMQRLGAALEEQAAAQKGWDRQCHGSVVETIELDNYFADRSQIRREVGDVRFFTEAPLDAPEGLTWRPLRKDLDRLKRGHGVRIPNHNYVDASTRHGQTLKAPAPYLLVDGHLALNDRKVSQLGDVRIFVDADREVRSERWWKRANERIKNADEIKSVLFRKAMASHDAYIEPSKDKADIVIQNQSNAPERLADVQETVDELARLWVKTTYPVTHG
jgi:uridine kinase